MFMKFWIAIAIIVLPAMAQAADVSGIPKIREGDHIQIGNARIRLAGIDAPGRDLPSPGVGDEPVPPEQQDAPVGVEDHRSRRLVRHAYDVMFEPPPARYLDVVLAAIAPDGQCHNRLGLAGKWQDSPGLGDWWGRAVWALGVAAASGPEWARPQAL